MHTLPAPATSGLKLRPVFLNTTFPKVSAFQPLTIEKSPVILSSKIKSRPLNLRASLGGAGITVPLPSGVSFIGNPPS
jgi:hypothetical protein